jgi:hypothetical protein
MPVFIASLVGALVQAAGTLVGRVLLSLGIGYVSYTGIDTSLAWLRQTIAAQWSGLPSQTLAVASAMQLGSGVSVIMSAFAARLVLEGLTSGVMKRMVLK